MPLNIKVAGMRKIPTDIREWDQFFREKILVIPDDNSTDTDQLVDNSVTLEKLLDIDENTFIGRISAGTGDPEMLDQSVVETFYNSEVDAASQAEAEAGTEVAIRRWSPLRIAQAIIALAKNLVITTVTTTSHTAATEDIILVDDDTAGSTVTVSLPAAADRSKPYEIKKLGTTANVVIDGDGSETIDGNLTVTLAMQYLSLTLISDGSNWNLV